MAALFGGVEVESEMLVAETECLSSSRFHHVVPGKALTNTVGTQVE
jgi:hypothetical protein